MTNLAFTKTLTAGQPENVNDLSTNLQSLLDALNGTNDAGVFDKAGLTAGGVVRRGKSIIATTESRTNTAYGTLTTPDQVSSVVLPTDGLIAVAYQATWQESVNGAGKAAIFVGANQLLEATAADGVPQNFGVGSIIAGAGGIDKPLVSFWGGLYGSAATATPYTGDVSTGQPVALLGAAGTSGVGGPCYIFAAAGTYTVSVQFKSTSGSVTAKNRKLWVWTLGF